MLTVAPKTLSGQPIQEYRGRLHERALEQFRPRQDAVDRAVERLEQLGFDVLRRGRFGITIAGPAELVSDTLEVNLIVQARPSRTTVRSTQNFAVSYLAPEAHDLYVAPTESLTVKSKVSDHIDHFVFTPPPLLFGAPSAVPPSQNYFTLDAAAIRRLLNVPSDATGEGVNVALIDTGFFKHPYYTTNNFDYRPMATKTAPDPENDRIGHGTAIAYNTLSVAPRATLMGFKQTDPPQDAIEEAAHAGAHIISCSWGWEKEQSFTILEATIRSIVQEGKIVLFASGNGIQAWPGSMPEIISVGGVFSDQNGVLEASNFASGYLSSMYPGRRVPDVSGLCGQRPAGIYILMPSAPGSILDHNLSGPSYPDRDETATDDGWLCSSGTSSAAPQVAGLVALLLQRSRQKGITLTTDTARSLLQQTAKPVERGSSAQGVPAMGHPNIAVGHGLVDAANALSQI